jgi:NAD(P)-dependent dehydrogenase (short-subunit alcohol dehydrogenase family)
MGAGEVVVITGASAGIGRATARRFARDGARIGLLARGLTGLEAAKRDVEEAGGDALALATDVADADQIEVAAERVEEELGPIDVWINNAMVTVYADFLDVEPDEFRRATEVTYLGTVWGTRSALRRMVPRDRGMLVQIGSALSYRGIPLQGPYCGAKHAVKGFTETIITELLHRGSNVHVTMVHLPAVNTPQFTWGRTKLEKQTQPVPPIYQPEVAADAVHWAAHHRRRELYVGAPTVLNVIGEKIAPWLLDRYLAKTGVHSQLTSHPLSPDDHDNLFDPVEEDRGAHGPFGRRSHSRSLQLELTKRRGWLLGAAGSLAAGAMVMETRSGAKRRRP